MIRVLGLVQGEFSSHTVRVLEIGKALRDSGKFDVSFSGNGEHMKLVENAGFPYVETRTLRKGDIMSSIETELFPRLYHKENTEELFREEDGLLRMMKPEIIIRDCFRELAGIAAKQYGVFDVFLQQANLTLYYHADFKPGNTPGYLRFLPGERVIKIPFTDFCPLIRIGEWWFRRKGGKYLHKKTKELGLRLDRKTYEGSEADLVLIPDSEILFPLGRMKEKYKFIGPILVLNQSDEPEWKVDFISDERKKIITTSGSTGMQDRGEFFSRAFGDNKYAVAVHGKNIRVFYSGDFEISSVIEYADLFITHGGIGSTYLGMMKGIPMIAVYKHFEQQANAMQMRKLGIGLALDVTKASSEKLREIADSVLGDTGYREKARNVAERMNSGNSLEKAVEYISQGYAEFRKGL